MNVLRPTEDPLGTIAALDFDQQAVYRIHDVLLP
jgi:hypothetical protein